MEPNVKMDIAQFNRNVEMYGFEAAVSWASQHPNSIHKQLDEAFLCGETKEGYDYWSNINANKGKKTTTSQATPPTHPTPTKPKESNKLLPMEEEIQRRIDERKATNAKNEAIHEKAIELAEASRKKLEKKLKQLMVANGVEVE